MNFRKYNIVIPCLTAVLIASCGDKKHSESEGESHADEEHADEIVIHPEEAEKFGIKTISVTPVEFHNVIPASGSVDYSPESSVTLSSPVSGRLSLVSGISVGTPVKVGQIVAEIRAEGISGGNVDAAAKARLDAAKRELDRITPLHADGIVTTRDLNAARQAYQEAKAAYSPAAASGRVSSPIAGVIAALPAANNEIVAVGTPVATVVRQGRLTLRVDVLEKYYPELSGVTSCHILTPGTDRWISLDDLDGRKEGIVSGNQSEGRQGYVTVIFSFSNDGSVNPGSFAEVNLLSGKRDGVIAVPSEAITEQQGQTFVYKRLDEHGYEKMPVVCGMTDGRLTEIKSGIQPGDEVVSEGTVFVKLAETKGNAPEGHSHNH